MIVTLAKTLTGSALSETGMQLRLQYPQFPYRLPHKEGGYVLLQRYGVAEGVPVASVAQPASGGCGCGKTTCGQDCGCQGGMKHDPFMPSPRVVPGVPMLMAAELVRYSGFAADGVTLTLVERGCEGTTAQAWPAGSLLVQSVSGEEFNAILTRLANLEAIHGISHGNGKLV